MAALAQAAGSPKVAVINTQAFLAEKGGINKYAAEFKKLEIEFAPDVNELTTLTTKITTLENELRAMQANKNVPINPDVAKAKAIEYEKLGKDYKFKKDDYDTRYSRRQAELIQPINDDIGDKIQTFAESKGFDLVLDLSNLARDGSLLYFGKTIDLTSQFIVYYNALPATSAKK
jgi:Skp family chaperone for outer membrane proteins